MSEQNNADLPEVPTTDPTARPEEVQAAPQRTEEHTQGPDFEPTNASDVLQPGGDLQTGTVHLPSVISDLYGMSSMAARQTLREATVKVGEDELTGKEKIDAPREKILGKEIVVVGEFRSVRFTYSG